MGREMMFWSSRLLLSIVASGILGYSNLLDALTAPELKNSIGAVVQTAVTMLGFVLASLAVLATITPTKLVRNMSKTGHYSVLLGRMFSCIVTFGSVAALGMVLLFIPTIPAIVALLVIALMVLAIFVLGDVLLKLKMVLRALV